jgi:ATP-binding cassette subfamily B protein
MLIRLLREHLRTRRSSLVLIVAMQAVSTVGMLVLPTLNADIIDNGVVKGDTGHILRIGGLMLVVALVQAAGTAGAVFYGARTAMAVGRDIRVSIFDRVQAFSARETGRFGIPSLITRTTNDVQQVQMVALLTFTTIVSAPIMCVGGAVLALRQNTPLSSLLLVALPAMAVIFSLILRRLRPLVRLVQERVDKINQVLREQITGVRVIRAFVRDDRERERFTRTSTELMDVSIRAGWLMAMMFPMVMLLANACSVAVVWFGGRLVADGSMQVGALTAFLSYLMLILMTAMLATFMFMMVPRAEVCAERIEEVLGTESSVVPPMAPVRPDGVHGLLELRSVEFRYPGAEHPVLCDVDLVARPGEVTAVIGSTGSGKTTLLNLVPRLFDASGGSVRVDGVDVKELDPRFLAEVVGFVPQKPYLFSGTVASNLRYGRPEATEEELWRALEIAQAREFVERMPDGLDAVIAQGGTNVSGGQRQRLAIARALVRGPEIYLFDDSFSALDYGTDAALRTALIAETAGATVVIVAQRVSTIRNADRIIVLDQGQVVGAGTHAELMDGNQTYREIVLSQLTEQEAAA